MILIASNPYEHGLVNDLSNILGSSCFKLIDIHIKINDAMILHPAQLPKPPSGS